MRIGAPISDETIIASVVFPSPGGPEKSMWSATIVRSLAAVNSRFNWSRTLNCPTNSFKVFGRRASSAILSASSAPLLIIRSLINFYH